MPELPEVETVRRQAEQRLVGKKVAEVVVKNPRVIRYPSPAEFKKGIEGRSFTRVLRRAKLLVLELSGGKFLAIHLKMTGQLVYPGTGEASKVRFRLSGGEFLDFNDTRLFAELRLVDDWRELPFVKGLGPEPFEISEKRFSDMLALKKTKIKALIMDQGFISGIGNLYAAEILFAARIHPERPAASLSSEEKSRLFSAMRQVLASAIEHRGSSVDSYVQLSGKPGEYVPLHKVYGREGKPCFGCKGKVRRTTMGGRGTYFCPSCQK